MSLRRTSTGSRRPSRSPRRSSRPVRRTHADTPRYAPRSLEDRTRFSTLRAVSRGIPTPGDGPPRRCDEDAHREVWMLACTQSREPPSVVWTSSSHLWTPTSDLLRSVADFSGLRRSQSGQSTSSSRRLRRSFSRLRSMISREYAVLAATPRAWSARLHELQKDSDQSVAPASSMVGARHVLDVRSTKSGVTPSPLLHNPDPNVTSIVRVVPSVR